MFDDMSGPSTRERTKIAHHAATTAWIRATFNAAATYFDNDPLFFWDYCGQRTVELARPAPGMKVLDVCCGAGASAIPAAASVGPAGNVVGIDLAERLLQRARVKAHVHELANIDFRVGDMTVLDVPDGSFDLVICALGIYFAPDLPAAIAELWRVVRPGGMLAVTTWGRRALEPANSMYLDVVEAERADLRPEVISWTRIDTPKTLTQSFLDGGTLTPAIVEETITHSITAEGFWSIVLGSGYRLLVDLMGPEAAERVRTSLRRRMDGAGVTEIIADILYARAVKAND